MSGRGKHHERFEKRDKKMVRSAWRGDPATNMARRTSIYKERGERSNKQRPDSGLVCFSRSMSPFLAPEALLPHSVLVSHSSPGLI